MPRRNAAIKREILPDPLYTSIELAKFINVVMRKGKKSVAEHIVYNALNEVNKRLKKDKHGASKKDDTEGEGGSSGSSKARFVANKGNLDSLEKALHNIRPTVEVKSRRVGGATYQVPVEVNRKRAQSLAIRWILEAARGKITSGT